METPTGGRGAVAQPEISKSAAASQERGKRNADGRGRSVDGTWSNNEMPFNDGLCLETTRPGGLLVLQWIAIQVPQGIEGQINIQLFPVSQIHEKMKDAQEKD